jgi:8-oxo-dGTP diphosphatase
MPKYDQGVSLDRYMLIPRTLIFLIRGDHILLIKGAPTKRLWANKYNGIGGHIEQGEDTLSAAKRELKEETGLIPDDLWLCGTISVDTGQNPGIGIYVFRGECSTDVLQESAEGKLEWLPINEIVNQPLVEDLFTLIPKVVSQKKSDPPFSAMYSYDAEDHLVIEFGA